MPKSLDEIRAQMRMTKGWPGPDRMPEEKQEEIIRNGVLLFAIEIGWLDIKTPDAEELFFSLCDINTINFVKPYTISSPLNAAIARSIPWLVSALLKDGANVAVEGFRHFSVLDYNLKRGPIDKTISQEYTSDDLTILTLLTLYGFNVKADSIDGTKPLCTLEQLLSCGRIDATLYEECAKILQDGIAFTGSEVTFTTLRGVVDLIYQCAQEAKVSPEEYDPGSCKYSFG